MIMKNSRGQFYVPRDEFNSIPGWFVEQAYMMRMRENASLRVEGVSVAADEPISLSNGWSFVSYYPRVSVDAVVALSDLVATDHLLIAKNGAGHFYVPMHDFSNIGEMHEGLGYQFRVDDDVEFSYVTEDPNGLITNGSVHRQTFSIPTKLPEVPSTGFNMSLLIFGQEDLFGEIGVYDGDLLVGSGVLQEGMVGIAVWGDDPTTFVVDGATENQVIDIQFVNGLGSSKISYTSISGSNEYQTDSFWAIELEQAAIEVPESFELLSVYPNPFNSQTNIRYNLTETGHVKLSLFDVSGRLVNNLISGVHKTGVNSATLKGNDLSSGVYIVQLNANGIINRQKVMLMK
jgi:hypothetical protein